ncbi:MAG: 8-oxo-dGTP diphosphatase [Anaerolineaceae bacterium]|nr:8-oxo-dGTP diphosphatase [Anaerolineaceae bacterium]
MRLTTLCYIEKDSCWLLMHRVKKNQDENAGKWIGIGGHLEENESPEECIRRECREEAGVELLDLKLRGILTFILPAWGNELTFLYTARTESTELPECQEGVLKWVPIRDVHSLPLWEGDKLFLPLLQTESEVFSLKLVYDKDGNLLTGSREI